MPRSIFEDLTRMLGRRVDDAELVRFLARLGCKPPNNTTDNDWTAHIKAKKHGLELAFSHIVRDRTKYPPRKENRRYVTYLTCAWLREGFAEPLPGGLG